MTFNQKVVVLTGASHGIGLGIAKAFIQEGARVYSIDKDVCEDEEVRTFIGDIANQYDRELFIEHVISQTNRIDILVHNAMEKSQGILSPIDLDQFERILTIGITAPYHLISLCKKYMPVGSSMINIISTRAFQSQKNTEAYSSAKGGLNSLTHALANSLAPQIRVNAIAPGWIDTVDYALSKEDKAQHLTNSVGHVEDIAEAVLFLSSSKAKFITGETLVVDGGMSKRMIYHNDEGWKYHIE
jgi:NAD(P)-dependent dehydrogenase (short-subunit alcohol dehydrogenase family)